TVPAVVGETSAQARQDLQAAGFHVIVQHVSVSDPAQDDLVQSQNPSANQSAPEGSTVTIYVGQFSGTTATDTGPGPRRAARACASPCSRAVVRAGTSSPSRRRAG